MLTFWLAGVDPVAVADKISQFVLDYDLDGVDVDYEVRFISV